MYGLFAHAPGWFVLTAFMLVPAVLAMAIHAVFRRFVSARLLLPHHDVAGFLVSVVGVLYAVVLGFLVINVWSSFDQTQRNADAETTRIADILYVAQGLPADTHMRERRLLGAYAFEVRDVEWAMLADGQEDARARGLMIAALREIAMMQIPPHVHLYEAQRLSSLRESALASFRDLAANRRLRMIDAKSHIQPALYFALIVGGLMLLAFAFLFGVENVSIQLVMTGLVAAMIGLQMGVIFELDRPFSGGVHVRSDAWTVLIRDNRLSI